MRGAGWGVRRDLLSRPPRTGRVGRALARTGVEPGRARDAGSGAHQGVPDRQNGPLLDPRREDRTILCSGAGIRYDLPPEPGRADHFRGTETLRTRLPPTRSRPRRGRGRSLGDRTGPAFRTGPTFPPRSTPAGVGTEPRPGRKNAATHPRGPNVEPFSDPSAGSDPLAPQREPAAAAEHEHEQAARGEPWPGIAPATAARVTRRD
jgi:hypothetical protein